MRSLRNFSNGAANPPARKKIKGLRRAAFALVIGALFAGCAGCGQCKSCKAGEKEALVIRNVADVMDFQVVFLNGEATLFWKDSPDSFLDHIEITWDPDGNEPVRVAKGAEKQAVPGLELDKMYNFTVIAVDQWGNRSPGTSGGTGMAYKQERDAGLPKAEIMGIKGTPVAGQVTLSWTNIPENEYEYIEITYDPNHEALFRVPKGVESRTLMNLVNGLEHTFFVAAIDSQGNRKPVPELGIFISDNATSPESVYGRPQNGQITLVWNDPSDPHLDHLEVVYSPNGEIPVNVPRGVQTKTFTDLSDATEYEFTVYAADIVGRKRPVTGVDVIVPSSSSFSEEDIEAFSIKGYPVAGQIMLDWNDPALAGLDHIEIIYNPGGGDTPIAVGKGIENHVFNGLSDNREYSFLVYGVDSRGNKRAIRGVNLTTPRLPVLKANPVSGKVTVVWDDPDDPNLSHIEVSYSPDGQIPVNVAPGVGSHTFTGLSDNIEYEFTVTAVINRDDTRAVPMADALVTELPVIKGTPTDGRLSLKWTDPEGVNVDHVEIVYTPGGEQVRLIAKGMENQTFTGLRNGREHAFTVYAVDSSGNK
ncbi:MAG: fibronectin type III domain-containing protein, partial [Treponema sp.]|nr:fibronectin type III domain-containing protein [Treponema sp.]